MGQVSDEKISGCFRQGRYHKRRPARGANRNPQLQSPPPLITRKDEQMTSHFEHITKLSLTVMLLCGVSLALAQTGAARITTASGVRAAILKRLDQVARLFP